MEPLWTRKRLLSCFPREPGITLLFLASTLANGLLSDINFETPFDAVSETVGIHTTYLDTIGRPTVTFNYENLTPKQAETILVSLELLL